MRRIVNRLRKKSYLIVLLISLGAGILILISGSSLWHLTSGLFFGSCRGLVSREIVTNTLSLSLKWTFKAEDPIVSRPTIVDGIVFIKTVSKDCMTNSPRQTKLIAVDAVTGKKLWESNFQGLVQDIVPVALKGIVANPIDNGNALRGINQESGQTVWEFQLQKYGGPIWGLVRDSEYFYLGTGIDPIQIYAISPKTGQVVWQKSDGFPIRSRIGILAHLEGVQVLFSDMIFVLDSQTGQLQQQYKANLSTVLERFSSLDNMVYIVPPESIAAVDLNSGETLWTFSPACIKQRSENEGEGADLRIGRFFVFPPTPIHNRVFTTGGCHAIFALNKSTGVKEWEYDNDNVDSISQVASMGDVGYVVFSDWSIRAIDLRIGNELGRMETQSAKAVNWDVNSQGLGTWKNMLYATLQGQSLYAFE